MNLKDCNMNNIIFVQQRLRHLIYKCQEYNKRVSILYQSIYSIMKNINNSFDKNIINQLNYNNNLSKLENVLNIYKTLPKNISVYDLKSYNIKLLNKNLKELYRKLIIIAEKNGCSKMDTLFPLLFFKEIEKTDFYSDKNIVSYINNIFTPTSHELYKKDSVIQSNETELTIYNENNSMKTYDFFHIGKLTNIMFTKIYKKKLSMTEHIHGVRIYILLNNENTKYILVMNGYFADDPLNISRIGGLLENKNKELNKLLIKSKIQINVKFRIGYIEQLSLRDFLVYSETEIIENLQNAYNTVLKYKKNTISSVVKEFLNKSIEEQRDIITLFLLFDDIEVQYLAYLMYDMISNESYLLKPQPLAEQVYYSLHWSIQKIFKNTIKRVSEYTNKIVNFNMEEIPYEKRIFLMKAPENVKQKALEKYKEISNKGNENCAKSQQYLDSLLKIPFGIYRKESVLNIIDDIKIKLELLLDNTINILDEFKDTHIYQNIYIIELIILCKSHKKQILYYDTVELILKKLEKLNSNIINTYLDTIDFNDKKYIKDLVEFYVNNNKNKDISDFIKTINHDLKSYNISFKNKTNKNTYKQNILETLNNPIIKNNIKKKYIYFIQNIERNYDELDKSNENIESIFISKYEIISNKIAELVKEWHQFKQTTKDYINNTETILNNAVHGQDEAKNEVKRIIAQWINGEMDGYCLGFEGPPGTGKTSLAKKGISSCLVDNGKTRPFAFIALGGSSNGSTLEGHNYTYVGSTYGKIVEILIETQCMNPIIYVDELDKISNTENGKELIGILTHMTDPSQNEQFGDKYFSGINIDLSKVLFIFSYNDYNLLDPILADRIHRIKFSYLSKKEKIHIMNNYIVPELCHTIGFNKSSIIFKKQVIEFIIRNYTYEAGVRKLKEKIFEIIREINLRFITENKDFKEPIEITINDIKNYFEKKAKILITKISDSPRIGLINGLFATSSGIGGITIIEAFKTQSDSKLSLEITGQQGDVMKESIKCAKTVAWNVIPNSIKNKIQCDWKDNGPFGLHIHCPEAATPKDGPSAGTAITVAIISLLTNTKILNNVALTGEIDLNGSVHQIGGLDLKIDGGKFAGVTKILIPKHNEQDLEIIKKTKPEIVNDIEIVIISNVWEAIQHCLEPNTIDFNHYS